MKKLALPAKKFTSSLAGSEVRGHATRAIPFVEVTAPSDLQQHRPHVFKQHSLCSVNTWTLCLLTAGTDWWPPLCRHSEGRRWPGYIFPSGRRQELSVCRATFPCTVHTRQVCVKHLLEDWMSLGFIKKNICFDWGFCIQNCRIEVLIMVCAAIKFALCHFQI